MKVRRREISKLRNSQEEEDMSSLSLSLLSADPMSSGRPNLPTAAAELHPIAHSFFLAQGQHHLTTKPAQCQRDSALADTASDCTMACCPPDVSHQSNRSHERRGGPAGSSATAAAGTAAAGTAPAGTTAASPPTSRRSVYRALLQTSQDGSLDAASMRSAG
jgi:hypothetical protein